MSTDEVSGPPSPADQSDESRLGALIASERERGFPSFAGTHAEIAVPVRQVLIDGLVANALRRSPGTDMRIDILEGARLAVSVSHRVFGLPASARTVLTIEPSVDLRSRRLVLRHEDSLLWRTIRSVVAPLGFLPAGVSFGDRVVLVDLETLATRGGWADLLGLVTRLEIHGPADGLLLIDADVEIHDRPNGPPSVRVAPPAGGPAIRSEDVMEGIAGARARADIHVNETLVNDVLGEVRRMLGAGNARGPRSAPVNTSWWMSGVRDVSVRFDRGRLVLMIDVEVPGPPESDSAEMTSR